MNHRLRKTLAEHPGTADLAIALALFAVLGTVAGIGATSAAHGLAAALARGLLCGAVALPLAVRRRVPYVALAGTLCLAILAFALSEPPPPTVFPVGVALYTIGATGSRRGSLAAAGAAIGFGLVIGLLLRSGGRNFSEEILRDVGWVLASLALGVAIANRRAYIDEIKQRALQAEHTREEEAQRRVNEERLRIAREVHDGVAHALASISIQASAASAVLDSDPAGAREALGQIRAASVSALAELRATLAVLRQTDEDAISPVPTLEELDELADVVRAGGIEVTVRYETPDTLLPADVGHAAYRILQEALTNVLRHSGAHRAEVTISRDEGHLTLTVSDDGRGPGDGAVRGAGYGLTGMRERAASVGGSLQFGPNRSGGFVVEALLPFAGSS